MTYQTGTAVSRKSGASVNPSNSSRSSLATFRRSHSATEPPNKNKAANQRHAAVVAICASNFAASNGIVMESANSRSATEPKDHRRSHRGAEEFGSDPWAIAQDGVVSKGPWAESPFVDRDPSFGGRWSVLADTAGRPADRKSV